MPDSQEAGAAATAEVVVVDDESLVHYQVERALAATDWRVVTFSDPESAVAYLEGPVQPSAVILDLRMPRLSGLELLGQLADRIKERIVVCSATEPPADDRKAIMAHGVGLLSKDSLGDRSRLLQVLEALRRGEPAPAALW